MSNSDDSPRNLRAELESGPTIHLDWSGTPDEHLRREDVFLDTFRPAFDPGAAAGHLDAASRRNRYGKTFSLNLILDLLRRQGTGSASKSAINPDLHLYVDKLEKLFAVENPLDTRVSLDLQAELFSHMSDQTAGFSPRLDISSPAVDCLGRPIKRPDPLHIFLHTGHVNRGTTNFDYRR